MNLIIYAPYKGNRVFWALWGYTPDEVRENLARAGEVRPGEFDGIYQFYCRSEDRYPIEVEEEEDDE